MSIFVVFMCMTLRLVINYIQNHKSHLPLDFFSVFFFWVIEITKKGTSPKGKKTETKQKAHCPFAPLSILHDLMKAVVR